MTASNQFIQLELTTNSAIAEGATVLVSYEWAQEFQGFNLVVSNNVDVACVVQRDQPISGKGYAGGNGFWQLARARATRRIIHLPLPAGGGGAHGGSGGMSSTARHRRRRVL